MVTCVSGFVPLGLLQGTLVDSSPQGRLQGTLVDSSPQGRLQGTLGLGLGLVLGLEIRKTNIK